MRQSNKDIFLKIGGQDLSPGAGKSLGNSEFRMKNSELGGVRVPGVCYKETAQRLLRGMGESDVLRYPLSIGQSQVIIPGERVVDRLGERNVLVDRINRSDRLGGYDCSNERNKRGERQKPFYPCKLKERGNK